jgi:hypothetical protein
VRVDRGDRRPVDDLPGEQSSVLELAKTRSPGTAKRSTLDPADARTLAPGADEGAQELERLRAAVASAKALADAGTPLSFDRLAAEFSLRSVEALHDWAMWAMTEVDR